MSHYGYVPPPPSMWGGVVVLIFLANVIFSTVHYCTQKEVRIPAQLMKDADQTDPVR